MQTTHNGRNYELTAQPALPNLAADLVRRGWDGITYMGVAKATGKQRKDAIGLFYRNAKTGQFVSVL